MWERRLAIAQKRAAYKRRIALAAIAQANSELKELTAKLQLLIDNAQKEQDALAAAKIPEDMIDRIRQEHERAIAQAKIEIDGRRERLAYLTQTQQAQLEIENLIVATVMAERPKPKVTIAPISGTARVEIGDDLTARITISDDMPPRPNTTTVSGD